MYESKEDNELVVTQCAICFCLSLHQAMETTKEQNTISVIAITETQLQLLVQYLDTQLLFSGNWLKNFKSMQN